MGMNKQEIENALEAIKEAHSAWDTARAKFASDVRYIMDRLINEAVAQYMSAEDIAKHSGFTAKRVRLEMRAQRLDPKGGRRLLAKTAADTLASNALIMGVEPADMDLMSPLAYLPMGKKMRQEFLETEAVKTGVHELPGDDGGYGGAAQMARKLTDAGLSYDEAVDWVNSVVHSGRGVQE